MYLDRDGESDSNESVCVPCGTPPRDKTSFDVSLPIVDLPILRAGISANDFTILTTEEFAQAQQSDTELQLFCEWINAKQCLWKTILYPLSGRIKALAQVFNQVSLRE